LQAKTQETVAQLGDAKTQAEGLADQAKGAAQELYGRASEGRRKLDAAKETATPPSKLPPRSKIPCGTQSNTTLNGGFYRARPRLALGQDAPLNLAIGFHWGIRAQLY
jgi:uncharacterized protein YjbJ (UPF0337 family)